MSKSAAAVISPEDAQKIRTWIPEFLSTFNGMDDLGEPFATLFANVKQQMNGLLSKLPPTDGVPAAQEAGWILNCLMSSLTNTQLMLNHTGMRMKELATRNSASDPAALQGAVDKAIEDKIAAGEIIKKDIHLSLCSNAKSEGLTEGEQKVRDEIAAKEKKGQLIAERKNFLTTNGLPLPAEDAALDGTDDEFKARTETAKARVEKLKGHKVALNSPVMPYVWADEKEFKGVETALTAQRASAGAPPAEPLATPPGGSTGDKAKDKKAPIFVV